MSAKKVTTYVCDRCGAKVRDQSDYSNPPGGWFQVFYRGAPNEMVGGHLCSVGCLTSWAKLAPGLATAQARANERERRAHWREQTRDLQGSKP